MTTLSHMFTSASTGPNMMQSNIGTAVLDILEICMIQLDIMQYQWQSYIISIYQSNVKQYVGKPEQATVHSTNKLWPVWLQQLAKAESPVHYQISYIDHSTQTKLHVAGLLYCRWVYHANAINYTWTMCFWTTVRMIVHSNTHISQLLKCTIITNHALHFILLRSLQNILLLETPTMSSWAVFVMGRQKASKNSMHCLCSICPGE